MYDIVPGNIGLSLGLEFRCYKASGTIWEYNGNMVFQLKIKGIGVIVFESFLFDFLKRFK